MRKQTLILVAIAVTVVIAAVVGAKLYRGEVQNVRQPATADSRLVRPDSPTIGPADAAVTVVEFLDPECESCRAMHPKVKNILKRYDGKVRLVVRYMPLHPNSMLAATWMEAAGEQGKYWQMYDKLFERQDEWGLKHGSHDASAQPDAKAIFEKYAMEMGLDLDKMIAARNTNRFTEKILRDQTDGRTLGVRRTPTFFVNGRELARMSETDLIALIEEELK